MQLKEFQIAILNKLKQYVEALEKAYKGLCVCNGLFCPTRGSTTKRSCVLPNAISNPQNAYKNAHITNK